MGLKNDEKMPEKTHRKQRQNQPKNQNKKARQIIIKSKRHFRAKK